jgi:hypothetical protein
MKVYLCWKDWDILFESARGPLSGMDTSRERMNSEQEISMKCLQIQRYPRYSVRAADMDPVDCYHFSIIP